MIDNKEEVSQSKPKRVGNIISVVMFLTGIIGLFLITLIKPDKDFSENENRVLADKPEFSLRTVYDGTFTKSYETYVTDQFVARDNFIAMKVNAERILGKEVVNSVYFAPNNYLIQEHNKWSMDQSRINKNLNYVKDFIQTNKDIANVKLMLVPTAGTIYPEWLPENNVEYDQNAFIKQAKKNIGEEHVIDATNVLKEHKEDYIFYKTDHHWTSLGAYYGYTAWANKVGIEPYELDQFDRKVVSKDFWGTTYSKVNIKEEADDIELFTLKNGPNLTMSVKQDGSMAKNSIYDMKRLDQKDKYTVFLGGNNPYVEINSDVRNGKTLLVIKDSYAHCMVPFLANHYEKIILLDYRYYIKSTKKLMEDKNIKDVLLLYNVINLAEDSNMIMLSK